MSESVMKTRIQVRRGTTAEWQENKAVVPAAGEPCMNLDTGIVLFGNGKDSYETLLANYEAEKATKAEHYEGVRGAGEDDNAVIERVLGELEVSAEKDDIFVVKTLIAGDKYSYTSYVYNGSVWAAMDGNYNATNVYFDQDLTTTSAIGYVKLENGQATVSANGMNLVDVWNSIFVQEDKDIAVVAPSVSVSGSVKYIEVGSSDSQTVTVTYEDGSYEYGYTNDTGSEGDVASAVINNGSTGATVTAYSLMNGSEAIAPTVENGNSFVVNSGTKTSKASMSVKGSATYGDGKIPVSNMKKMYPAKAIVAGTTSVVNKELFRWYIPMYYGFKYAGGLVADPAAISAEEVKGLTAVTGASAYSATKPASATATGSWRQFFVAVPESYNAELASIIDSNKLPLTVEKAANVDLTFGEGTIEYEVFYVSLADDYDTVGITLGW